MLYEYELRRARDRVALVRVVVADWETLSWVPGPGRAPAGRVQWYRRPYGKKRWFRVGTSFSYFPVL